ncbi:MAG: hypothetical protein HXY30_04645, partial [Pseudorhodoplanes sp.]|nr:hypothetical protein [Pseudorhodoplanes sp.]
MTIYTDGLRLGPAQYDIEDLDVTMSESLAAEASAAANTWPVARLADMAELGEAMAPATEVTPLGREAGLGDIGLQGAADSPGAFIPGPAPAPIVPIDAARARVKEAGLDNILTLPDRPDIPERALDIMLQRARERREREATIARGPKGFVSGALHVGTSFLVSAVDPLNIASAFIPVVGEARYGKLLADAGTRLLPRAAVRARVGAVEGAAGAALMEPLEVLARTQEGQDYRYSEFLQQVMFGAALGSGLHMGVGAIGDVRARRRGGVAPKAPDVAPEATPVASLDRYDAPGDPLDRTPDVAEPAAPARETPAAGGEGAGGVDLTRQASPVGERSALITAVEDLPARANEDAMRVAVANLIEGRPVSAGEVLAAASETDPRIAVSLSAARNDFPPLPDGVRMAGHGEHGPVLEGYADRWTEAVDWLRQAQTGDAIGVLAHPEVPGGRIDVIWGQGGERGYGLAHIIEKHPDVVADLPARLARMRKVGEWGGRLQFDSPDGRERIAINTEWKNEKKVWLLTAFRRNESGPDDPAGFRPAPDLPPPLSRYYDGGAGPTANIGAESPSVDSAWRDLAGRPQDADEPLPPGPGPEPAAIAPEATERVQAAERAAAEAEAEYRAHEAYLPEDLKQRVDDELKAIDTEATDRAEILNRGAACL